MERKKSLVGNVLDRKRGFRLEQLSHQLMGCRSAACVCLVGVFLHVVDKLPHSVSWNVIVDGQDKWIRSHDGNRRKVIGGIPQLGVDRRIDGNRRNGSHDQSVTIRRRSGGKLRADDRLRAGLVLNHDRLAECLGQFLTDNARNDIHRAARRHRDDDPDRAVGVGRNIVRLRSRRGQSRTIRPRARIRSPP